MKSLTRILTFFAVVVLFVACQKEKMSTSSDPVLYFSDNVITFDTLFTSIGSPTKNLRVTNTTTENVIISTIKLAGGDQNGFHLNVNGEVSNESFNVQIPPKDSIFIFIQATLGVNGKNGPLITEDSIIFKVNNIEQRVRLKAWGQDFVLVNAGKIKTSVWTKDRPYLVYNEAVVDSDQILTMEAGTSVYFHKNAGLMVKGTLKVLGTFEDPVVFKGDRLEPAYSEIPDQWNGIILCSGSHNDVINHAQLNDSIGVVTDTGIQKQIMYIL